MSGSIEVSTTSTDNGTDKLPSAVGFIGLGNMGWPMALNLRKNLPKEHCTLYIYDILPSVLSSFATQCAQLGLGPVVPCADCREVGVKSDVTFTIVPEGSHVHTVFLDPSTGLLTSSSTPTSTSPSPSSSLANKIFIDSSTIDPPTSLSIARALSSLCPSARFYDAPVSGGTAGAQSASLTFMCGTSPHDALFAKKVDPMLRMMGKSVFCVGAQGLGLAAKLSNNYLSGMINIATSEAMNLGMRLGIEPKVLSDVFRKSSSANWVNDTINPVPGVTPHAVPSHGYKGGFKIQLMRKDVALALTEARRVGATLVLGDAGLAAYTAAAQDERCRDLDARVVYRWLGGAEPDVGGREEEGEEERRE